MTEEEIKYKGIVVGRVDRSKWSHNVLMGIQKLMEQE